MTEENESKETRRNFKLRLEARLKNGTLLEARGKLGITALEAAKRIGVNYTSYIRYESMRNFPRQETQERICDFYASQGISLTLEEAFPEGLRSRTQKGKYISEYEIPAECLIPLDKAKQIPVFTTNEEFELPDLIDDALKTLRPREARVLIGSFGLFGEEEKTLKEIGASESVGNERIRQIKEKALRKLRHYEKYRHLLDYHK